MPRHNLTLLAPNELDPTRWRDTFLSDGDRRPVLAPSDTVTANGVAYVVIGSEARTNTGESLRVFAYHVQPKEQSRENIGPSSG